MQQTLHLFVFDRDRRAALAVSAGSRWLLPLLTCGERARAAPLAARWCAERGVTGEVAGQWLGRVTPDALDWLVAITTCAEHAVSAPALRWQSLDVLISSAPVLEYQQWAIGRILSGHALPSVSGPFGNLAWPEEVRAWIGAATGSPAATLTPYRVGAHEVVLGADSARGRVYFKGLVGERTAEARLTEALATAVPDAFARTLALDRRADGSVWWLTAGCAGRSGGHVHRAAATFARVQQRVLATDALRELTAVDLEGAARWASDVLGDSPSGARMRRQCADVMGAAVPTAWIPMDLDPANILSDEQGGVRFIDLDDSFFGPAPLAMAILAARSADRTLYRAYESAWSPPLHGLDWEAFETAATVIQSWSGWKRLERNIARGEVYVDRGFAAERTRQRLARAIGGISLSPTRRGGPAA